MLYWVRKMAHWIQRGNLNSLSGMHTLKERINSYKWISDLPKYITTAYVHTQLSSNDNLSVGAGDAA